MYKWGLGWLGLLTLVFGGLYLASATNSLLSRFAGLGRVRALPADASVSSGAGSNRSTLSFPEQSRITTPAFFETPIKLLAGVHRSFLKLAVGMSILVFVFWACVYALALTGDRRNPSSQIGLMRSHLLIPGPDAQHGRPAAPGRPTAESVTYVTADARSDERREQTGTKPPAQSGGSAQLDELALQVEENDYKNAKRYKEQYAAIEAQKSELASIRGTTSQLQQTTTGLPEQLNELGSRASAAEARAGQVGSEAAAARQSADQLAAKIKDVENRAARASDQVGRVEGQVSTLLTRTEALDRELERRARQIEARTEELGVRTEDLKEANERIQRIAFASILSELNATANELDHRVTAQSYRIVSRLDTRREAAALSQRIKALTTEIQDLKVDASPQWLAELEELSKRVDDIVSRIK
jgi:chromosome segregation ATPase